MAWRSNANSAGSPFQGAFGPQVAVVGHSMGEICDICGRQGRGGQGGEHGESGAKQAA